MKLLGIADQYPNVIAAFASDIEWIEARLGTIYIRAQLIPDLVREGVKTLGWMIDPEDKTLVCVFPTYNWGPGVGPRPSLDEAILALKTELEQCLRIEPGKPGPRVEAAS